MKNILVTGGSGKAGRATIKLLLKNNLKQKPKTNTLIKKEVLHGVLSVVMKI